MNTGLKVLVIGNDGYVGAALASGLKDEGDQVFTVSDSLDLADYIKENEIQKIYYVHYQEGGNKYSVEEVETAAQQTGANVIAVYTVREPVRSETGG